MTTQAQKVEELQELMKALRQQTPSAPAWYQVIDVVVGTLLQIELNRAMPRHSVDFLEGIEEGRAAEAKKWQEIVQGMANAMRRKPKDE